MPDEAGAREGCKIRAYETGVCSDKYTPCPDGFQSRATIKGTA